MSKNKQWQTARGLLIVVSLLAGCQGLDPSLLTGLTGPTMAASSAPSPAPTASPGPAMTTSPSPAPIEALTLSPDQVELNAPPAVGTPEPDFVTSAQLTVTVLPTSDAALSLRWSSSDPSRVMVDDKGFIQAVPGASTGSVCITVSAPDDPSTQATASVVVTDHSALAIGVD